MTKGLTENNRNYTHLEAVQKLHRHEGKNTNLGRGIEGLIYQ